MDKLISQQAAIDKIKKRLFETAFNNVGIKQNIDETLIDVAENRLKNWLDELPSVQPNHCAEVGKKVLIDRQEALEAIGTLQTYKLFAGDDMLLIDQAEAQTELMGLPSVQPTLYGYNIEHLELIARVLQKEDLPPERVVEALTDIGRIVAIVKDEFEETLRKAVEQCTT